MEKLRDRATSMREGRRKPALRKPRSAFLGPPEVSRYRGSFWLLPDRQGGLSVHWAAELRLKPGREEETGGLSGNFFQL